MYFCLSIQCLQDNTNNFFSTIVTLDPVCQYNQDCPTNLACDRLSRTCMDPCLRDECAPTAICRAIDHRATCQCPAGYSGNPNIECVIRKFCARNYVSFTFPKVIDFQVVLGPWPKIYLHLKQSYLTDSFIFLQRQAAETTVPAHPLRLASIASAKIHVSVVKMPSVKCPITEPLVVAHPATQVTHYKVAVYQPTLVTMTPVVKVRFVNWTMAIQYVCVQEALLATLLTSAVSVFAVQFLSCIYYHHLPHHYCCQQHKQF